LRLPAFYFRPTAFLSVNENQEESRKDYLDCIMKVWQNAAVWLTKYRMKQGFFSSVSLI